MKSQIETELKRKSIENLSEDSKNTYKLNTINGLVKDIEDKKNRYIFYCPDITMVNPLVKIVYEVALQAKKAGFNVTILHELQGFKAKWLFESEDYKEYRSLNVEYIINKVSKKSKREKNLYTFRVTDTLIVTDAYQEMLHNILSEESLKLMQKIVLVTGYMGLQTLSPGVDYNRLNVASLVFFDENIKADYETLFMSTKSYLLDTYPVSSGFRKDRVPTAEIAPVILISNIGANEKSQEIINIFYNKYPSLNMFTFKVVDRENIDTYIENVATAAIFAILDKNIVTKQMLNESISMGVPVLLPLRRDFLDNRIVVENFCVEDDTFIIAEKLAEYCTFWLEAPTGSIKEQILQLAKELELDKRTPELFADQVTGIFSEFQEARSKTFMGLREQMI